MLLTRIYHGTFGLAEKTYTSQPLPAAYLETIRKYGKIAFVVVRWRESLGERRRHLSL